VNFTRTETQRRGPSTGSGTALRQAALGTVAEPLEAPSHRDAALRQAQEPRFDKPLWEQSLSRSKRSRTETQPFDTLRNRLQKRPDGKRRSNSLEASFFLSSYPCLTP
ncbi:MAG: hypothetical protein LBS86_04015, partial [Treponema sp.]|nr:hypothetical protein [Treponema sp.]